MAIEREVELALQALAHDLHVQQAEEAAAEPEPERARRLRHVRDRRVVEPQPLEALAQVLEVVAVHRVETAEHHRLRRAVAGKGLGTAAPALGHGLADAGLPDVLDPGDEVADLARTELGDRGRRGQSHPDLVGLVDGAGLHEPDPGLRAQTAVHHPDGAHHAAVLVVLAVEDERLQRRVGVAGRRRDALDDGVEQLGHALAGLGGEAQDVLGGDAEHGLDLVGVPVGIGGRQVDLVERGHDLEVVLHAPSSSWPGSGPRSPGKRRPRAPRPRTPPASATPRSRSRRGPGVSIRWSVWPFHDTRTFWALMVMPRSRSRSMESRYWARMSRASTAPVISRIRSDSVDLPWSMWAMIEKLRMRASCMARSMLPTPLVRAREVDGGAAPRSAVDDEAVARCGDGQAAALGGDADGSDELVGGHRRPDRRRRSHAAAPAAVGSYR